MDARHAKYQYLKAWTLIKKNPHSEKTRLLTVLSPVQFSSVRTILPLQKAGYPDVFVVPNSKTTENGNDSSSDNDDIGRPLMDDSERNSDPGNSETGAAPKPSSEDGSERKTE